MSTKGLREKYLVFGSPLIGREEREEVMACIDSRWVGTGPRVHRLENDFRTYTGAKAVVAVSSGTAALHLALRELDLDAGSEVITTAMTFCATANAIVHAGLRPVFADCERTTMNLDPSDVERKISPRTRAILPVHFAGLPCSMDAIMEIARKHSLKVVEDCAHAVESRFDGRHVGLFGDFGCFSFYVTKNMTTVEGGMVICRDEASAKHVKMLALHGMSTDAWRRFSDEGYAHYEVVAPGFKYNLTDLAACFGIHQLARIEKNYETRKKIWDYYLAELADLPLILPVVPPSGVRHALHLFTCLVDDKRTRITRDEVLRALHEMRIGAGVHYRALHLHQYYREAYGYRAGDMPNSEWIGDRTFSIPLSAALSEDDARDVVRALRTILS